VQNMLRPGPRPAAAATASSSAAPPSSGSQPVLGQAAYVDLLSTVVDAALKAAPSSNSAQPARRGVVAGPAAPRVQPTPQPPTEAQIEQNVARRLLNGLQPILPMIDQYLPAKAPMVREKLTDLGMLNNSMANLAQTFSALQGDPSADALLQAAQGAPPQMQPRLYQQAAYKAIDEGNTERARQIANDHLQNNARDVVMQRIDFKEMAMKADGTRIADIRQMVARLQTDNEKIDLLIQVAGDVQKTNEKVALQLLEDARQIVNRRATSYEQFEQQLKVAHAFSTVDPSRSFEVLDPGISQLNELLSAAAMLSGFEINMFRDGEMSIQGGNGLTSTVTRFGQELAVLARSDFERSDTLAGRFQFAEPRIMARMQIVQGLLGVKPASGQRVFFGNVGGGDSFVIRQE
jgi:NAD(P)-dependent dehydrogenase (short-subunit alcohol dehydrogenase family)